MKLILKELSKEELPREKLIENGVESLSDSELLALLLHTGTKEENVFRMSSRIIRDVGIENFPRLSYQKMIQIKGISKAKATTIIAAFEFYSRSTKQIKNKNSIKSAKDIFNMLSDDAKKWKQEKFVLFTLDTKNRIIRKVILFTGTVNSNLIHPRDIFREAIEDNATSIIISHNHPSGNTEPSSEDISVTKELVKSSKYIGIELLDHIIIGDDYYSMREENLIEF